MSEIIKKENIIIKDRVSGWEEAIKISAQPLINSGDIESRYVEAIYESTRKNGPYYVLAPNIAMPHAGINDGVIQQSSALLIVKEPIKFSETSYEVRLIFLLAPENNHSHLGMLRTLSELFMDEDRVNRLIHAETIDEAYELVNHTKGDS